MSARTPPGTLIVAVGDVHGRFDLLQRLLGSIADDAARRSARRRLLVMLGDYVSRGPESRRVVQWLVDPPPAGFERIALRGNHEDLWLRYLDGELDAGRHWFDYDGLDTLASYGVDAGAHGGSRDDAQLELLRERLRQAMPPAHLDVLRATRAGYRSGGYFFAHAGVRPGVALPQQQPHDLMWIRTPFLDSVLDHGAIVVHGHSIADQPQWRGNRIGIDTGASRSGVLTALVLDGVERAILQTR